MTDDLEALLHRCHRDELLPLARLVGAPETLGLGDLAKQCAISYRGKATHGLETASRGGEPRTYPRILAALAEERKLPVGSLEETELAVVKDYVRTGWKGLSTEDRAKAWRDLGLPGDPPPSGDQLLAQADSLGRGVGYGLTRMVRILPDPKIAAAIGALGPLGCMFRPLTIPVLLWVFLRPEERIVVAGALEIARLRQIVLHRVTIGVVGSPSTGKDAAIKALFGIDTGNVSPIAGSTKEVAIQRVPGATALYLVNTPGMGDVVERVTEEARQVLDHIDLYLYLVNAEGGVQAREKTDYNRCKDTGKPVLAIVNKIDVLRPRDKDAFLDDAKSKLGAKDEDFVAAAFDPLPQLSPGPIGREFVREWLVQHLVELGKDPAELPPLPETRA